MEREAQKALNYFSYKGRKLEEPDDGRLTATEMRMAGIPRKYWDSVWDYYPEDFPPLKVLRQYVEDLEKHRKDGKGLLLCGATRKGKTFASVLIAKEIIRRNGLPLFVPAYRIPALIMSEDEEDVDVYIKMMNTAFLIIDDLGADAGGNRVAAMTEQVIRERDSEMRATIISTNLSRKNMKEGFGEPLTEVIREACIRANFSPEEKESK